MWLYRGNWLLVSLTQRSAAAATAHARRPSLLHCRRTDLRGNLRSVLFLLHVRWSAAPPPIMLALRLLCHVLD